VLVLQVVHKTVVTDNLLVRQALAQLMLAVVVADRQTALLEAQVDLAAAVKALVMARHIAVFQESLELFMAVVVAALVTQAVLTVLVLVVLDTKVLLLLNLRDRHGLIC